MNTFAVDQNIKNQIDGELYAILPVVEQVLLLHERGRYGFDICPQNIVMTQRGALLRVKNIMLNASGASIFRPGYTPRERYVGGILGPWTDVYAVSALVYTAMTGLMLPSAFERGNGDPLFGGLDGKYRVLEGVVTQGLAPDVAQRLKSLDALCTQMQVCLDGYMPPSAKRADKPRRPIKQTRTAAAILIAVLLLLSGAVVVNEVNYAQAVTLTDEGSYALAQKSLKGVFTFYKDAAPLSAYAAAGINLDNGVYDAAAQGFLALGGYRNSEGLVRETNYRHAQALIQQGNLAEAEQLLSAVGAYKESSQLLKQISYQNGVTYKEAGMYLSAFQAFQSASDYEDAAVQAEEVKDLLYHAAIRALGAGDMDTAAKYYAAIPGYEKADELAALTALLARINSGGAVTQDEYDFVVGFANTVNLTPYLTSDALIADYLVGSWQDDAGNVFSLDGSGGITSNINGFAEGSYTFGDGMLFIGTDAVFRFSCVDINTLELFAYEEETTYIMKRESKSLQ